MKAILHGAYGPASLLEHADIAKPLPGPGQVLIRILATTVSSGDCNVRNLTFIPPSMRPIARLMFGIKRPWKKKILGTELAGVVEAVGNEVTMFSPGQRVVASTGALGGGHAQYVCLPEKGALTTIPDEMTFEEAAALPFGSTVALAFLRDLGKIAAGDELLILGASGSVGTAAIQLAKHFGATVTAVCGPTNTQLVRELGADAVIDYTREDFTGSGKKYDLILDTVAATSFKHARLALKDQGTYLQCVMSLADMFLRNPWSAISGSRKSKGAVVMEDKVRLESVIKLAAEGHLRPVIDRIYPLEQISEAFDYVEKRHKKGNVVIRVEHS
ncbi:NAD(P)-dependent alcohol dehydrogenase [bacterium]|nr:NAD(P)-dependent alcohol dehydrogenase [bacterium]